ncbi:MAG: ribosomal protein S12 methylthiotransferase RimO [Spirochaeta sp. LUC14_002_19_P3]|nr:MAG: ribosomal protein S12 methylthiotransferase RimO [Spirochaeta sp. LUC14_002_19_P3]
MASFYIENLGCSKNQVDAELMAASLKNHGWQYSPDAPQAADIIIINTCGFIKSAQKEAVDTILNTRKQFPHKKIIAAGCLAQRWPQELSKLIPEIDSVFSSRIPQQISQAAAAALAGIEPVYTETEELPERHDFFGFKRSVYLKISDGCNHNCRFCAIPLIKGRLVSRPQHNVLKEAAKLLENGAFELNLIAQDLASYGQDQGNQRGLIELLEALLAVKKPREEFWIRLLYLHPDNIPNELLQLMAAEPRILPYLDIPFQHASAQVLRKMGRRGTSQSYLALIENIRNTLPAAVIRSTFLTGHPGEGRAEFDELLRFQEAARLDWLGVFAWSREEGTAAARDKGALGARLNAPRAERRRQIIAEQQEPITRERMRRFIGQTLTALIEEPVSGEHCAIGRAYLHAPEVDGNIVVHTTSENHKMLMSGTVVEVKITGSSGFDLLGSAEP